MVEPLIEEISLAGVSLGFLDYGLTKGWVKQLTLHNHSLVWEFSAPDRHEWPCTIVALLISPLPALHELYIGVDPGLFSVDPDSVDEVSPMGCCLFLQRHLLLLKQLSVLPILLTKRICLLTESLLSYPCGDDRNSGEHCIGDC